MDVEMDRSGGGRESREDKGKREGESRHGRNWAGLESMAGKNSQ
jgi:hypothetical protein